MPRDKKQETRCEETNQQMTKNKPQERRNKKTRHKKKQTRDHIQDNNHRQRA